MQFSGKLYVFEEPNIEINIFEKENAVHIKRKSEIQGFLPSLNYIRFPT